MAVATYTKSGTKAASAAKLDMAVFGAMPENHDLLKAAYVAHLANRRDNLAVAKTRGLVRGGGKKPWKQKGTGRARAGSTRSPIWRGGGVVFGPTGEENFTHSLHKTAKRKAIRQALSLSAANGKLIVIEDFSVKDGKTAVAAKLLNKIGARRNTLVIVADKSEELVRATRNLPRVKLALARYINVYDIMNADSIVVTSSALTAISEWLGASAAGGEK